MRRTAYVLLLALVLLPLATAKCALCGQSAADSAFYSFDFTAMAALNKTYTSVTWPDSAPYYLTHPCGFADPPAPQCCGGTVTSPAVVGPGCQSLGSLNHSAIANVSPQGFNLTFLPNDVTQGATIVFQCDSTATQSQRPEPRVVMEGPKRVFTWRHPAACGVKVTQCPAAAPVAPPSPPPRLTACLPNWRPTWDMRNSTILYACNQSGMHNVSDAIRYGVVSYDWSNWKATWVSPPGGGPMIDEELLIKQAEAVLAADPGVPGGAPRVQLYLNSIKALVWLTSVREKIEDPQYAGWFVRFKDYKGAASNHSYHVPACTYEKCSGFYHDQLQTPEYPNGDGSCSSECDCGAVPCGEYIFDHRNDTFGDWFINEYAINNRTLLHDPPISLGWVDDSMRASGPTEEDAHFIEDTGASDEDMLNHVVAYNNNNDELRRRVLRMGGYIWQLFGGGPGVKELGTDSADQCASNLRNWCFPESLVTTSMRLYQVDPNDALANATQYTSEFLLTRGAYAYIGYSWRGCSGTFWPRPSLWEQDYGLPHGVCSETGTDTKVFTRSYDKADITWDCNKAKGTIEMH